MGDTLSVTWIVIVVVVIVWELVWKGIALWRAALANRPGWFIAILLINSAGLLPVTYLLIDSQAIHRRKKVLQ